MKKTHTAINGRSIEYDPTAAAERFLARVQSAVGNHKIDENDLRALIYGPENPLLDQQAGYTFVTAEVFEHPVFRVALDLLDRKRVAVGSLNLEETAARYTLSVHEAAERLGVTDSTVRMAVTAGRLPSWMHDKELRLAPESVDSYKVSRRGRPPKLLVTIGSQAGISLRIRILPLGGEIERPKKDGTLVHGEITSWERLGVITGAKRENNDGTTYRYWLIEPGGPERRIEHGDLKVVGRFTIVEQKGDKAASEAFKALEAPRSL